MIRGIKTEYKGVVFKSRLEAKWAKFFDSNGIEWEYESVRFKSGAVRYTPDFALFGRRIYVEIKPSMSYAEPKENFGMYLCQRLYPTLQVYGNPQKHVVMFPIFQKFSDAVRGLGRWPYHDFLQAFELVKSYESLIRPYSEGELDEFIIVSDLKILDNPPNKEAKLGKLETEIIQIIRKYHIGREGWPTLQRIRSYTGKTKAEWLPTEDLLKVLDSLKKGGFVEEFKEEWMRTHRYKVTS